MNRIVKTTLKITASAVILLVIAVAGGVGYSWYMSEHSADNSQAFQPPAKATGGARVQKRPKIPDTAQIGASVQNITSPVTPGSNASFTVKTNPEATCTISVMYNNVPSKDSGLTPKKADEYGIAEWTWTVPSSTPLGSWPVEATCANKKNSAVVKNDLRVVRTLE